MSSTTSAVDKAAVQEELPEKETELTTDKIYHILQNERRRNVLRYLQGTAEPLRMRDVAEQVAAWEHDTTVQGLSSDQRQRVYIPLYQSHLPKLDEEGIIDYQQSRGIVERKPRADLLDPYLDAEETNPSAALTTEEPWHDDYYIGLTALGSIMLFGAVFELPVFSTLSGIVIALILLLLLIIPTAGRFVTVPTAATPEQ